MNCPYCNAAQALDNFVAVKAVFRCGTWLTTYGPLKQSKDCRIAQLEKCK